MSGVPEHKCIPGTAITVDAFRHQQPWVKAYFLSHAHSDHYTGLTENWSAGPIYCSPVTAALAQQLCAVPAAFLRPLPLNTPHAIAEQPGLTVVLVDANHCPGAVQFLFTVPDGRRYVHCGDMRYSPAMKADAQLQKFVGADGVFLDTTYCHPRHLFPPQDEAVEFVASRIHQLLQEDAACTSPTAAAAAGAAAGAAVQPHIEDEAAAPTTPRQPPQQQQQQQEYGNQQQQQQQQEEDKPPPLPAAAVGRFRRLYLISTYVIGKERLLLAVAAVTGRRLLVSQRKMNVLRCVGLSPEQLQRCFTTDPAESPIHVTGWGHLGDTWPYFRPNFTNMEAARQEAGAEEVVGFVPTGWLHEMKSTAYPSRSKGPCSVHLVPYSEHSSYAELREYVAWLRPKQIIPTVGTSGGDKARTAMLQHFRGLIDEQHNKAAFLARMTSGGAASKRSLWTSGPVEAQAAAAVDGGREAASAADGVDGMVLDDDDAAAAGCEGADEDSSEGFWELPKQQRSASLAAAAAAQAAADTSMTEAVQAAADSPETAGQGASAPAAAAAAAVELGADTVASDERESVQLLLAIAGPESGLTASEAQQLLAAAAGDVNAAMNAFLDKQTRRQQQQQQARPQQGGSRVSGNKRQQQQQQGGGADARSSGGSKKARKQPASAAAGSGGSGQASITSFFGLRASPKQQQRQQVDAPVQKAAAAADAGKGAAAGAAASPATLVLPALTKQPRDASMGRQLRRAALPAAPHVQQQQQQQQQQDSRVEVTLPAPAEIAGTFLGSSVQLDTDLPAAIAAAEGQVAVVAAEEDAGLPTDEAQQQQQQKQLWSTLLSGSSPLSAKRTKSSSKPADNVAGSANPAAATSAANAQQHPTAARNAAAEAPEAAAAAAAPTKDTMPMLGVTSNSGSSSSKPLSKAIREAPLLKLAKYNPLRDACWSPTEAAPYLAVAVTLAAVDGTSSRLLIGDGLTNMFRSLMLLAPDQVTAAAYLVCGKIAPEYALGADLNIGGSVVSSALCEVCGVSRGQLRELYNSMGDLGDVAQACRRKQSSLLPPPPLTITGVFAALHSLASQSGQGAAGRRQSTVAKLLRCCRDVETKYLVRTLIQNLRVGAGWRSVLGPLAKAALLHRRMLQEAGLLEGQTQQQQQQQQGVQDGNASSSKTPAGTAVSTPPGDVAAAAAAFAASSAAKVSKQQLDAAAAAAAAAYHSCPNLDIIVQVLMSEGPEALAQHVQLTCGVPVKPMLAKACTSVADSFVQLAATAAAAAAGGVRAGRRSGAKQGAKGTAVEAKEASAAAAAALAVVVDSDDAADGSGDGAEGSGSAAEEDVLEDEQPAAAAAAGAGPDQPAATAGKQQQALLQGPAAAAGSSSSLTLLAEYKYDGQRAQIHIGADHRVAVFSRNCEDRTASFHAEAQAVLAAADPAALPLVIDAELVAVDRANGNRVRAFQELATRPRGSAAAAAVAVAGASAASPGAKQQPGKHQQQLAFGPAAAQGKQAESAEVSRQPLATAEAAPAPGQQQQQRQAGSSSAVDICVFAFDALCVGGRDLMGLSLRERRAALAEALPGLAPGVVQMAEGVEVQLPLPVRGTPVLQQATAAAEGAAVGVGAAAGAASEQGDEAATAAAAGSADAAASGSPAEESVTEFFFAALAAGSEGLMMKLLDGPGSVYQPAKRGLSWVKLKRDYLEGLADSLDLVPIGAWRGNGRKVKWFSPFLLAVYDPDTETFQSLCRCMSGFTDEFYAAATARLGATAIPGPKPYYDTHERPDVWFEPTEVWELRGADISISPVHRAAAGIIDPAKGLGLRFPRFLRLRPDKKPEEASGPEQIADLYNKQARRVR